MQGLDLIGKGAQSRSFYAGWATIHPAGFGDFRGYAFLVQNDSRAFVFLSHAGEDAEPACELARRLRQGGLDVWLDMEKLQPGDRWMSQIEKALHGASAFVVYVGANGVRNWVDNEVRVALDRSTRDTNFRLIPVLGPRSDPRILPTFLKQYQWLDLRQGFENLSVARIRELVGITVPQKSEGSSSISPEKPPFRGLIPFDIDDAIFFNGRDNEIEELLVRLSGSSFLTVIEDSGSGKSSVIRAGLIPALHRGRFHDGRTWVSSWRAAIFRPGENPFRSLVEGMIDLSPGLSPADRLDFLMRFEGPLSRGQLDIRSGLTALVPRGEAILIVVDQFEELFTLNRNSADRMQFIDTLLNAAREQNDRTLKIVIALRADFYSHCWEHKDLPAHIASNQLAVNRMSNPQLRQLIEKPLAIAGGTVQPGLLEVLLREVADEPGKLPLLEHTLLALWENRDGQVLTHQAYTEMGRLSGALRNHAERSYSRLKNDTARETAKKILLRLVQPGEGSEDTRRRARKADLLAIGSNVSTAAEVLESLVSARLVVLTSDSAGTKTEELADLAHESLIKEWPRLRSADRRAPRVLAH